ncbi:hypothetical protein [Ramlibacter alkalitolerans]|jgi:hypothetical protein|nr:hypothetical protein [Ramlibacter alkalitolerans]
MAAVLTHALIVAVARVIQQIPSLDDLLRSMNSGDALQDGSRYF